MSRNGSYILHVRCDDPLHPSGVLLVAEFDGATEKEAYAKAVKAHWFLSFAMDQCPTCRRRSDGS